MRLGGRGQLTGPPLRLARAAGVNRRSLRDTSELGVCRQVAYEVAQRSSSGRLGAVLSAAEELLGQEANYDLVVSFLEDLQNLVSHHIETLCTPQEITARLGPRCTACWSTLADFWASVGAWRGQAGMPAESADKILSVRDDQLRQLLWTTSRTLADGSVLGLADVILYEKAGGMSIPGYSHIAAAMNIAGQG